MHNGFYALLADGSTVEIRPAAAGDADAVREMHRAMSPDHIYLRFFSMSPAAAEMEARRICREPGPDHAALLAWLAGELVGVASYETCGAGRQAEIAFAVADHAHHRGVATLLLEHLVSAARARGVRTFAADVLTENSAMLQVFAAAGLRARRSQVDGVTELTFDLPGETADPAWQAYLDAVAAREGRADVASLRHVLAAESVAVAGAGPGSVGRAILRNILGGGYAGRLYVLDPQAGDAGGVACLPSPAELPEPVDLVLVCGPGPAVLDVAEACGRRGVRALAVVTAGLGSDDRTSLLACCRRHGMRLVGPASLGIAVPSMSLNATITATHPAPGMVGLAVQSGGIGTALLEQLTRLGLGISSYAALGDKADVSGNDLLMWWEQDPATRLAVLGLESFGNPRKFGRTARLAGATMPVLAVHAGQAASPAVTREALFGQAGIIAARDLAELIEAAALLASQPVPAGRRVAIVSSATGAGVLAAGACADAGLSHAVLDAGVQQRIRRLLPPEAQVNEVQITGPVDTTAAVSPDAFRRCLELVAADGGVDAVLALTAPTALGDLTPAACSADVAKPLALAVLSQAETVRLLPGRPGGPGPVPAYASPVSAVRALAHAAGYGAWRASPPGRLLDAADLRPDDAHGLVRGVLERAPDGGWLAPDQGAELLACYGIPLAGTGPAKAGTEVVIGVTQEPVFGPLVVFGLGGAAAGLPGDRSARLTPLTDTDADALIRSVRAAPLLLSQHGRPAADLAALRDLLMRVSRLADDLPQVTELDLSPVMAGPGGAHVTGARVRVRPAQAADPYLRRLR